MVSLFKEFDSFESTRLLLNILLFVIGPSQAVYETTLAYCHIMLVLVLLLGLGY